MHPFSALGQAFGAIGQGIGNAAHNVENFFWKPQQTAQATHAMPNASMSNSIKSPVPMIPMTNQMPPGMHSPIPQQQQIQRPIQPSGFQNMESTIGNFGHNVASFFGGQQSHAPAPMPIRQPQQQPQQQAQLPIRSISPGQQQVQTPQPTQIPGQNAWTQHMVQRFGGNSQNYNDLYKKAVTGPGWTGNYYGQQPSPTPTPQPGVGQVSQLPQQVQGVSPQFLQVLNNTILPVTRAAGIPDAVAAAQAAAESGYGRSQAAQNNNNYFGIMTFHDANGNPAPRAIRQFQSPAESAQIYAQTIQNLVPNLKGMTPLQVLQALQSGKQRYEADNPNPNQYVYDLTHTPVWNPYGGGAPYTTNPNGWAK